MGNADRNSNASSRSRIAAMQEAQHQAEQRRRLYTVAGVVVVVIAIVVGFIVLHGSSTPKQAGRGGLPASVINEVTSVSPSTLATIGTGSLPPRADLPIKSISDSAQAASGGKPNMLYIGAEFCPYCAAMRWSMAVALSRFGTFGPISGIHSSSTDVDPNTATLTFLHVKYTSKYLTFNPIENETVTHGPLQNPTKAQQAVWEKYGSANGGLVYPFIYFGGKVTVTGPLYDPAVLKGLTWSQIASQLNNPNSTVAKNVNGAANYVTAAICKMTSDQPASVCKAAPIPAIEPQL